MCASVKELVKTSNAHQLAFLSVIILLNACSEPQPDGHVYQMNGVGMTLPAAGVEIAFLPGQSRAEFFYEPLKEAYVYATADLGTELVPVCNQAQTLLTDLQELNDNALRELQGNGNLPATADACLNMCTQRISLEDQRLQERQQLVKTIARFNAEIANARENIKILQDSRSEKAGELGRRLAILESARENALSKGARQLLREQTAKIGFLIDEQVRYDTGKRVRVTLINGSDYALEKRSYSGGPTLQGYYRGVKIVEQEVRIPRYGEPETLQDEFGFILGYLVPPGGSVVLGDDSISDFPGLSVSTPEGRLLARERGWTGNSKGFILPDEIRIKAFSPNLFVIPDKDGTRTGSTITYKPKKVDFRAEAAAKGLPQDAEISRLKQQIDKQSYPEDAQINEQNALIASFNKQKKQVNDEFNNSALANQISQLTSSERSCRNARDAFAEIEGVSKNLSEIEANFSSCGSELLEPRAVLTGVAELNHSYYAGIETPDISSRYTTKAAALVMSKLSKSMEKTTLTGINGDYTIVDGVDPDTHIALVGWRSEFGQSFWFQPLVSLGAKKDLTYATAEDGAFGDYIEKVISYGDAVKSIDDLALRLTLGGAEVRSPFTMKTEFKSLAESAAENLLSLESEASEEIFDEGETTTEMSLTCEL